MIRSFADRETARLAMGIRSRKLPLDMQDKAVRLLRQMGRVRDWNELRKPSGNKLHALHGDRAGQYAIWINKQWRIAFTPVEGMLENVGITDYH